MWRKASSRAFRLKLALQEFYEQPDQRHAEDHVGRWYQWAAVRSRLEPMKRLTYTIRDHWDGIVNWYQTRLTTGRMEGLNSLIQAAKAQARGYRTVRNLIAIIYLLGGKLNYGLPQLSHKTARNPIKATKPEDLPELDPAHAQEELA